MANPREVFKAGKSRSFPFTAKLGMGRVRAFSVPGTTRTSCLVVLENAGDSVSRTGTLGTVTGTNVVTLEGSGKFVAHITCSSDTTIGLALEDTKPPTKPQTRTGATQPHRTR